MPNNLEKEIIVKLEEGQDEVLRTLSEPCGPQIEVQFVVGGRVDSISAWSLLLYTSSIPFQSDKFSEKDHEHFLKELHKEGVLLPWPTYTPGDPVFVLATESEKPL